MLKDIQNFLVLKLSENKKMAVASVADVMLMRGWLRPLSASLKGSFNRTGTPKIVVPLNLEKKKN